MDTQKVRDFGVKLEADIGVPNGFLFKRPLEDDWSFVIKVGAIVEAAVSELLLSAINDERLHPPFAKMELRGPDGKMAFLAALGLLSVEHRRFVDEVYALRNTVVHDIRRVSFTFEEYFTTLPSEQSRNFWRAMEASKDISSRVKSSRNYRRIIWLVLLNFLAALFIEKTKQRGERTFREQERSIHKSAFEIVTMMEELDDLGDFDSVQSGR